MEYPAFAGKVTFGMDTNLVNLRLEMLAIPSQVGIHVHQH